MLNSENYLDKVFNFRDRQAGVSVIYDPQSELFSYNAYCLETVLMEELFTCEYAFLDDALDVINQEFSSWELVDLSPQDSGCGSCVAK